MSGRSVRRARRGGGFDLRLGESERGLLRSLLPQLRAMLGGDDPHRDPSLRRLFPVAYPDDPERDDEFRSLVGDDLRRGRLDSIDVVESSLDATSVDDTQLQAWMQVVNDLRLVLGTLLDVSEDESPDVDPDAPDADARATYQYLSYLLDEIVTALARA